MSETILSVQNLHTSFTTGKGEVHAVNGVSFDLDTGKILGIVGESGSGKSTLLNMIGALDAPTSGKVLIDGKDIFSMNDQKLTVFRRRNIGFIFQAFNLVPSLNVWENIILPIGLDDRKPDMVYLKEIIELLGLGEKLNNLPNTLSGGQQQRVAIVRSILDSTKIILCDEPTASLDRKNTEIFMKTLVDITQKRNVAVMIVTHDENVVKYGTAKYYMEDGKIRKYE
mgnify:CR=1 FL=1